MYQLKLSLSEEMKYDLDKGILELAKESFLGSLGGYGETN